MIILNIEKYKALKKAPKRKIKITKFMFVIIITLITLILLKGNNNFKETFYKYIYDTSIAFPKINSLYQKYFGKQIPKKEKTDMVFNEKIKYNSKEKYKDGVLLKVDKNYSIPSISEGMVMFIGEKEGYGNTVIIEQTDGVTVWYSNITTNLKMYDYIEKGSTIGEANKEFYMLFKKGEQYLNYEDYI